MSANISANYQRCIDMMLERHHMNIKKSYEFEIISNRNYEMDY